MQVDMPITLYIYSFDLPRDIRRAVVLSRNELLDLCSNYVGTACGIDMLRSVDGVVSSTWDADEFQSAEDLVEAILTSGA